MITIRAIDEEKDSAALQHAIDTDTFHPGEWKVEHFFDGNGYCETIEDQHGPIAFVKLTKTLRISCVWNDGTDNHRNARAIVLGIRDAVQKAQGQGYTEIIIQTNVEKLSTFFERVVGMKKSGDEYILPLGNQ